MYQALYRKWRPKTFDEVAGQPHITETLKTQVASGRLSHAYLFTGTRGTGKTTCAKILARAVNCEHPVNGNPCNECPTCRGLLDGSLLDVLELDAASNNGVDHVRALRDEAIYAPTAAKKRVYIIDEVHMLTPQAFNALLKILEEPPEHLMFILATTELHKVLPTILSRCQRFSFKRILPEDIIGRLSYVAQQEGIDLQEDAAALLARLADGGMRDALSLLDQCAVGGGTVDREKVLDSLGLAGNLKTAHIMNAIRKGDAATAIARFGELYSAGKDVNALLNELISLSRDLLIRATAPDGAKGLLAGGYDEATLNTLSQHMPPERLIAMLELLQKAADDCKRSGSSRIVAELCLIRLCDPTLDGSNAGLAARVARLEEMVAKGVPVRREASAAAAEEDRPPIEAYEEEVPAFDEEPPFDVDAAAQPMAVPVRQAVPTAPTAPETPAAPAVQTPAPAEPAAPHPVQGVSWKDLVASMQAKVSPICRVFLKGANGVLEQDLLTIYFADKFAYDEVNKGDNLTKITEAVCERLGQSVRVELRQGEAEPEKKPAQSASGAPKGNMDMLKQFMKEHQK